MSETTHRAGEAAVPEDLRKALAATQAASAAWQSITPLARRDFVMWIEGAKQAKTRAGRIAKACDLLAKGKRRPCCYSVVPLDLYRALDATPTAKARYRALDSVQRRDLIAWIEDSLDKRERLRRIERTCVELAARPL